MTECSFLHGASEHRLAPFAETRVVVFVVDLQQQMISQWFFSQRFQLQHNLVSCKIAQGCRSARRSGQHPAVIRTNKMHPLLFSFTDTIAPKQSVDRRQRTTVRSSTTIVKGVRERSGSEHSFLKTYLELKQMSDPRERSQLSHAAAAARIKSRHRGSSQ